MSGPLINLEDEYLLSIDDIINQIAQGVANAQRALDEQSLELQRRLYTDENLKHLREVGIQATWYRIPEVTASIKVCISTHIEKDEQTQKLRPFLLFTPYNATTKSTYELDYEGTSEVSFKIIPIPTPSSATYTTVPKLLGQKLGDGEGIKSILEEAGLILGTITKETSDQPEDTVIKQDPEPDFSTYLGNSVNITVSEKQNPS